MSSETERESFEADWRTRHSPVPMNTRRRDDGRYGDSMIEQEWLAFKAGLSATTHPAEPPCTEPIDMVLHCPACGVQHIDAPDWCPAPSRSGFEALRWDNPPHRSHLCHDCDHIWRPADVPTNGVAAVATAGKADSPIRRTAPNGFLSDVYDQCCEAIKPLVDVGVLPGSVVESLQILVAEKTAGRAEPETSPAAEPLRTVTGDGAHPFTYASKQATNCACCGKYKHTPLRVDRMDGYVCLTCIDKRLEDLLDREAEARTVTGDGAGELPDNVYETKFEAWLSEHQRTPHHIGYSKQDMRDGYWAGFQECAQALMGRATEATQHDELSLDPDGDVSMDWRAGDALLSISVAPTGRVALAWADGPSHGSRRADFPPESHAILLAVLAAARQRAATAQAAEAVEALTDERIEAIATKAGARWDGSRWVIEDADLHPLARALVAASQP